MITTSPAKKSGTFTSSIILAGLIAGTLDITAACIQFYIMTERGPETIFRYIASAVVGKDAFSGGMGMILLGFFLHYLIAFIWTILFFLLYPRIRSISGNIIVNAFVYGLIVWSLMNLVIVPLTRINRAPIDFVKAIPGILIIIFCVGLPISIVAERYFRRKKESI